LLCTCARSGAPVPTTGSTRAAPTAPIASAGNPVPLPSSSPAPVAGPSLSPAVGAPHVFVIVMENSSFARAMANPYIAGLAAQYAAATNYHAVGSPSLPNYLALTSGSTWGITD